MTRAQPKPSSSTIRLAMLAGCGTALALAAPLRAAITDFQLPPSPNQTPQPQGPVVEGETTAPRVTTTVSPTPSPAPAPTPTPAPPPASERETAAEPAPRTPPSAPPGPAPSGASTPEPTAVQPATDQLPVETGALPVEVRPAAPTATATLDTGQAPAVEPAGPIGSLSWWWLSVPILLLLIALAAIVAQLRQRRRQVPEIVVPQVVKPQVRPEPDRTIDDAQELPKAVQTPTPAAMTDTPQGPLSIGIEARYLSISLTAATLSYRLTITNSAKTSLRDVVISGDMISAHSSISEADQIATETVELEQRHVIDRLPARESVQISGEFRLPFTRIKPIRKGDAALFVPLARLRANAGDAGTIVQTALVGQRATRPGARLQPFRLDLGPRVYREVTQRIFS